VLEALPNRERGQIFVSVKWKQPRDDARIYRIRLVGFVSEPGQPNVPFARDCQRATTDLSNVVEVPNFVALSFTNLTCFTEVNKVVPIATGPTGECSLADLQTLGTRLATMKVNYSVQAYGRRPPMAYVAWINGELTGIYHRIASVTSLFDRKWVS
jgi:hypothetical protein